MHLLPSPNAPRRVRLRRVARLLAVAGLAAAVVSGVGVGVAQSPAGAGTTDGCAPVVDDVRTAVAGLPNKNAQPGSAAQAERTEQATALFTDAAEVHPECANDLQALGAELAAAARRQATIRGTAFWGPIGWMWNNVYYRVFNANNVMMAMFGWALLLSPFILVSSAYWVLRGARGAFHRPFVPEHLRTDS